MMSVPSWPVVTAEMHTAFLFDIDSVLVEPRGYRAGVIATLEHFTRPLGVPAHILPDEADMEAFEALRITSEWDMVPLSLLVLLEAWLGSLRKLEPPLDLGGFGRLDFPSELIKIDYKRALAPLGKAIHTSVYPSETALNLYRHGAIFPGLQGSPLVEKLLTDTRDVTASRTTRVFQHFSLGHQAYEKVYGLSAEFESASLLLEMDTPLLSSRLRGQVYERIAGGVLHATAYTQRPSGPPRGTPDGLLGYAPEAEFALQLVNLQDLPLIGFGRMRYLAENHAVEPETLLKPSPVQALAAIGAALSGEELGSLEDTYAFFKKSADGGRAELPDWAAAPLEVHVFEDSAGGIEAVQRAGDLLRDAGAEIRVHPYGIAQNEAKIQALKGVGARIYATTDEAVGDALARP